METLTLLKIAIFGALLWLAYKTFWPKKKKENEDEQITPINRWVNYLFGFIFCSLVTAVSISIFGRYLTMNWGFYAFITAIVFFIIGYNGLRKVEIKHSGVILLLEKRIGEKVILDEGWGWIIPWVMNITSVDMREQSMNVPETVVVSKNKIRMTIDTEQLWEIVNPHKSLSVSEDIIRGLKTVTINTLREEATKYTDEELMDVKESLGDAVYKAADSITDRWGVNLKQVLISKIVPTNPKVMEAWEMETIEEREAVAEKKQNLSLAENIELLSGNGEKMSREVAAAIHMEERGKKSPIQKIIVAGDDGNPIVKAAGMFHATLTKKNKGE